MSYKLEFKEIERKWQKIWEKSREFVAEDFSLKPKYYILDMFPYPSGSGLHVGHPLGYIASDIYARYKRLEGFNVLHPIGIDAFGLPAEQHAMQTNQHPAVSTQKNIDNYVSQLKKLGLSYDWSRFFKTSDSDYYKWTQYLFLQMFESWYDIDEQKAKPISLLVKLFETNGNIKIKAHTEYKRNFLNKEWNEDFSKTERDSILLEYRLAYLKKTKVNWCPELGTVLANDEVKNGYSERGGYPVYQKETLQWLLRVSAYAERLLKDLDQLSWTDSIKEIQKNWIGKSEGVELYFEVEGHEDKIKVFTTRPDTVFGVNFIVLAPEHELVRKITVEDKAEDIKKYLQSTERKTDFERISNTKQVSGVATGTFSIHPITKERIPIWVADYVLITYGTGAVMAVPAGDKRDWVFANHNDLPMHSIFKNHDINFGPYKDKEKEVEYKNSKFLDGLNYVEASKRIKNYIRDNMIGNIKINYKLKDAVFSRQRYWGEPFPMYYKNELPYPIPEKELPLELPEITNYFPTKEGFPPLERLREKWKYNGCFLDINVMPGYAASSWYFLRYLDPSNNKIFADSKKIDYWKNVDLYIGGAEHATGHLIYSRFFVKLMNDLGLIPFKEPFKKMINQGMIQGISAYIFRDIKKKKIFSKTLSKGEETILIPIPIDFLKNNHEVDIEKLKNWRKEFKTFTFELEEGKLICEREVEKMSKSKYNTVAPDELIEKYGADTLRCYEMFLGPVEQHKPWNTKGIEGVFRFLNKFWNLFYKEDIFFVSDKTPSEKELRILHQAIKKIKEDINRFSFNTVVSELMITVNKLSDLKSSNKEVLSKLLILLSPYAPHISEELWHKLGNKERISYQVFPKYKDSYITKENFDYPISFNGKMRFKLNIDLNCSTKEIETKVLNHKNTQKYIEKGEGAVKKIIIVPGRIVNIVF